MCVINYAFRDTENYSVYVSVQYYFLLLQVICTSTADYYLPLVYIREVVSIYHPKTTAIALKVMWAVWATLILSLTILIIWLVELQIRVKE